MDVRVWNLLHDGSIADIKRGDGGDVEFVVEIQYIAEELGLGDQPLRVRVRRCTEMSFKPFDGSGEVHNVERMRGLELLSAKQRGPVLEVMLTAGVLRLVYETEQVVLGSGQVITYDQVASAADRSVEKWRRGE